MGSSIKVECVNCKHHWKPTFRELEQADSIFRDVSFDIQTNVDRYRVKCPACGTYNVITVIREQGDGETGRYIP